MPEVPVPSAPVRSLWPHDREATGTKAVTALRRGGIATVGDLAQASPQDITDLKGAGPVILAEIRAALAEHGLSLREDDGITPAELETRVRMLMRGGLRRVAALRFARESWPKGEIAAGIQIEVTE